MRAYERDLFSYLCSISDEWHSKTGKSLGLYAAVSPHPNPLPVGEDKNSLAVAESTRRAPNFLSMSPGL